MIGVIQALRNWLVRRIDRLKFDETRPVPLDMDIVDAQLYRMQKKAEALTDTKWNLNGGAR